MLNDEFINKVTEFNKEYAEYIVWLNACPHTITEEEKAQEFLKRELNLPFQKRMLVDVWTCEEEEPECHMPPELVDNMLKLLTEEINNEKL